jgi:hypothetical protein
VHQQADLWSTGKKKGSAVGMIIIGFQ